MYVVGVFLVCILGLLSNVNGITNNYFDVSVYGFIVRDTTNLKRKIINVHSTKSDSIAYVVILEFDSLGFLQKEKSRSGTKEFKYKNRRLVSVVSEKNIQWYKYYDDYSVKVFFTKNDTSIFNGYRYDLKGALVYKYDGDYDYSYTYDAPINVVMYTQSGEDGGVRHKIFNTYKDNYLVSVVHESTSFYEGNQTISKTKNIFDYNDVGDVVFQKYIGSERGFQRKFSYEYEYWD
ncbi:MAG: hypothetical protein OCC49_01070 [Fibrobacterales bacterium]